MVNTDTVKMIDKLHTQAVELARQLGALKASLVAAAQTPTPKPVVAKAKPAAAVGLLPAELKAQIKAELLAELKKGPKVKRPTPRQWSMEEKRKILHEAAGAKSQWGGVQRVMNKYGISSAHLVQWRDQVKAAARAAQA